MNNETAFLLFVLLFCGFLVLVGFIAGTFYTLWSMRNRSNQERDGDL